METHNASIYHCISCGRVVHAELEAEPPQCCGHTMTNACAETINEREVTEENAGSQSEVMPPVIKGSNKPR